MVISATIITVAVLFYIKMFLIFTVFINCTNVSYLVVLPIASYNVIINLNVNFYTRPTWNNAGNRVGCSPVLLV